MIQFSLKCDQDHAFDSWFASSDAYEKLASAGHVTCPQCGSNKVEKAIMAPRVSTARKKAAAPEPAQPVASTPDPDMQKTLEEMKRKVEENSDYVGDKFAQEARAMHVGDAPERAIYGEANAKEAKSLIEDGVPVLPLPFTPTRKTN